MPNLRLRWTLRVGEDVRHHERLLADSQRKGPIASIERRPRGVQNGNWVRSWCRMKRLTNNSQLGFSVRITRAMTVGLLPTLYNYLIRCREVGLPGRSKNAIQVQIKSIDGRRVTDAMAVEFRSQQLETHSLRRRGRGRPMPLWARWPSPSKPSARRSGESDGSARGRSRGSE